MVTVVHSGFRGLARHTVEYGFSMQEAMDNFKCEEFWDRHRDPHIDIDLYHCGFLPPNYPVPVTVP